MVKSTEVANLYDTTAAFGMHLTRLRAVHFEGLMNPVAMVVVEVARQDPPQMPLIEDDHMVEALSTDTSDQSLDERILPRTSRCADHLLDAHVLDATLEERSIDPVTIS